MSADTCADWHVHIFCPCPYAPVTNCPVILFLLNQSSHRTPSVNQKKCRKQSLGDLVNMSINAKLQQQQKQTKAKRQISHEIPLQSQFLRIECNYRAASSKTTREQFYITSRCQLDCLEAQTNYNCVLSRDIMADAKRRETCLLCVDQVVFSFSSLPMPLSLTDFINLDCILLQFPFLSAYWNCLHPDL